MLRISTIIKGDHAQQFLLKYLAETEHLLRRALQQLDAGAECQIVPAADLGVPYDVLRLAGGFATGCLIEWDCNVPVAPVDTTMNIDTSSIFWLDGDPADAFSEQAIESLRRRIERDSSYEWNLNRGNHFILLCRRDTDGRDALVLHSNEKEFKDQFNGLCPTPGNWYEDSIVTSDSERQIRLLVGQKAKLFVQLAHMLEEFNILRHRFIATMLLGDSSTTTDEHHKHHYFMPTSTSAAIGCYICEPLEEVPLFSSVGRSIAIFQPAVGGQNTVTFRSGEKKLIVPHGWGMTAHRPLAVTQTKTHLHFNGRQFCLAPSVSLLDDPDVGPRLFNGGSGDFLNTIHAHTPGIIKSNLHQIASVVVSAPTLHHKAGAFPRHAVTHFDHCLLTPLPEVKKVNSRSRMSPAECAGGCWLQSTRSTSKPA